MKTLDIPDFEKPYGESARPRPSSDYLTGQAQMQRSVDHEINRNRNSGQIDSKAGRESPFVSSANKMLYQVPTNSQSVIIENQLPRKNPQTNVHTDS